MYDPPKIEKMYAEGVMSRERRDFLLNFPTQYSLVIHEAGVPPIHTPLKVLEELPSDIKSRIYIVHCNSHKVSGDSGLKMSKEGVEHSVSIPVQKPIFSKTTKVLDLIASVDFFQDFPLDKVSELLQICSICRYDAGEEIPDTKTFRLISQGFVESNKADGSKFLTVGDFFGYRSLVI